MKGIVSNYLGETVEIGSMLVVELSKRNVTL